MLLAILLAVLCGADRRDVKLLRDADMHLAPKELETLPWFRQNEPYQVGYHLVTHGLREEANHPEFELCNVPGAFINASANLLNEIADRVLDGERFANGENMGFSDGDDFLKVIAFREIVPHGVLRVLFLC